MSMTLLIEGGMASYVGCDGAGAACVEGIAAASAAAIEVAMSVKGASEKLDVSD